MTLINYLTADNLPTISDNMKNHLGNKRNIISFCSLENVNNADKLTFISRIFLFLVNLLFLQRKVIER